MNGKRARYICTERFSQQYDKISGELFALSPNSLVKAKVNVASRLEFIIVADKIASREEKKGAGY
jgi:hypothetical protein